MKRIFVAAALFMVLFVIGFELKKTYFNYPESSLAPDRWMRGQIKKEINFFRRKKISIEEMEKHYSNYYAVIKIQIRDNKIEIFPSSELKNSWIFLRYTLFEKALKELEGKYSLPNITMFLGLWDSYDTDQEFPLFVFAKKKQILGEIMVPDCYAITRSLTPSADCILHNAAGIPWKERGEKLIWRGSTSQGLQLTQENYQSISRLTLCQLSQRYPQIIDAGFTLYYQGADKIPEMQQYRKDHLSYLELIKSKYQLWIDGNSASYSDSGWRFLVKSVVLKPESDNIQWYYIRLKAGRDYIPIKANLDDLVEKIVFLQKNDSCAEAISNNGYKIACELLAKESMLRYLYCCIWEYSKLSFTK